MKGDTPLVLETNAVLDWLLFRDRDFVPIAAVIESGSVQLLSTADCVEELRRVLAYPQFNRDAAAQTAFMREYLARVQLLEPHPVAGLPQCSDPDDQKFLELAVHAGAVLLTKDRALLRLSKRVARGWTCRILRPAQWLAEQAGEAAPPL